MLDVGAREKGEREREGGWRKDDHSWFSFFFFFFLEGIKDLIIDSMLIKLRRENRR